MIEYNDDIYPQSGAPHLLPVLTECADAIRELAKIGSKVFVWDATAEHRSDIDSHAIWLNLRTIIELVDAISALVRNSSIDPAKIQLRVLTEVVLGLEHILKDQSGRMSLSYLYKCALQDLKAAKKLDLSHEPESELVDFLKLDKLRGHSLPVVDRAEVSNTIARLERLLASARFNPIRSNNPHLKSTQNAWYSAFYGPNDIRVLSKSLRRTFFYYSIYDRFSRSVHGTPYFNKFFRSESDSQLVMRPINQTDSLIEVVQATFDLTILALRLVLYQRIPNRREEFEKSFGSIHSFFVERLPKFKVESI